MILTAILRHRQNYIASSIDEQNLTPSDFAVQATNLPVKKTQEEVKEWIKKFYAEIEIQYINYAYNIGDIVKAARRLSNLQQLKSYVQAYKAKKLRKEGIDEQEADAKEIDLHPPPKKFCCCMKKEYPTIEVLEEHISKAEKVLEKLKKEMEVNTEKDLYCGTAFIVVNKQSHANRLIYKFQMSMVRRAFNFVIYNIFRCKDAKVDERYWEGQRVIVERAAEPTDIFWENLSVTTIERVKKSLATYGVTALCLLIAFGINLGLSILKDSLEDSSGGASTGAAAAIRVISIFTSFLVVFINVVLGRIIRILSAYEKHETYTKYHLSVAVKLTIALFVNTGIVPLFVNFGRKRWFDQGGLMVDIFYNTLSVCFVSPFFYLFNPVHLIKKLRVCIEEARGEDSKMTQRQANALFEGPPLDMAQRYANTMLLLCMTVFYAFPLPVMPLLTLGGSAFQYWVEKWVLLRRHKIPEQMGATMAQVFSNMIPFLCFLYGLSMFAFSDILSEGEAVIGLVAWIFTIIYLLLPVRVILQKCRSEVFRHDDMTHEKHKVTFLSDYDRSNPMTEKEANIKFIEEMAAAGEMDKDQVEQRKQYYAQGGRYGGIMHYGDSANGLQGRVYNTYRPTFMVIPQQNYQYGGYNYGNAGYSNYTVSYANQGYSQRYVAKMYMPVNATGQNQAYTAASVMQRQAVYPNYQNVAYNQVAPVPGSTVNYQAATGYYQASTGYVQNNAAAQPNYYQAQNSAQPGQVYYQPTANQPTTTYVNAAQY